MDNDDRELMLRRQSVRTLTAPEMSLAYGGQGGHNNPPTSGPKDRTSGPTTTKTK
ncbi:MAG: hypothetical protein ACSLFA_27650 [Mycobacterium sp.]